VPFFESIVLFDVMEVVTSDDDGAVHFCGLHNALEDTSTDGDISGEGAFVVNVFPLNRGLRDAEAETNITPPSHSLGAFV